MRRQTTTLVTWGALIALVLAAIVWLSRDQDVANTSPPSPKTAADGTANRGDSLRSRVQEPASPAARIPSGQPAAPLAIPAVHLRFQAPYDYEERGLITAIVVTHLVQVNHTLAIRDIHGKRTAGDISDADLGDAYLCSPGS